MLSYTKFLYLIFANKRFRIGRHQAPGLSDCQSEPFNVCPTVRTKILPGLLQTYIFTFDIYTFTCSFSSTLVIISPYFFFRAKISFPRYYIFLNNTRYYSEEGNIHSTTMRSTVTTSNLYSTYVDTHSKCVLAHSIRRNFVRHSIYALTDSEPRLTPSFTQLLYQCQSIDCPPSPLPTAFLPQKLMGW